MTNKFYLKLILAALLLLPIIGMAQATNNQLDFLKPLVGEKCAVYLKNGDVINGTLWVYGHDYVSLKVKKGLLYSKTEKYAVSEIDYIKDKAANRYYMPKVSKLSNEKPPTRLYIGPDASDVSEHSNADQEFQGTLRFLKSGEKKQDGQKASEPAPQHVVPQTVQPKVAKTTPPSQQPNIVDKSMPEKSSIFRTPQQTGTPRHGRKPAAVVPVSGKAQIASHKKADDSAKMAKAEPRQKPLVATPVGSSEAKELKILRYQTFVLFGCAALIVALLMFFKMTGLKGTTYGKYTLFPSRIIKLEGDYGIIDQGKVDGVKTDDILRLYKKSGSRVQYKAKVKVKKVGENYSAIQLVDLKAGHRLELGDVGFRDRNLLATSWKRLRIILSAALRGMAKGFQVTARNLDVDSEDVAIDLRPPRVESTESPKVKTVNRKSSNGTRNGARKKPPVTTVKPTRDSKPVGFGLG